MELQCYEVAFGSSDYDAAEQIEEAVFLQNSYPYNYRAYRHQSHLIGAFMSGECVGALRLIATSPVVIPFFHGSVIDDPKTWMGMGSCFEEVGTIAVLSHLEHQGIGMALYREAWVNARKRGVTHWGIVLEDERVKFFNDVLNFDFHPAGPLGWREPESDRVWGDVGSFVAEIEACERKIAQNDPAEWEWLLEALPPQLRR
jgi:predicted N-acetyltransferase YhbS